MQLRSQLWETARPVAFVHVRRLRVALSRLVVRPADQALVADAIGHAAAIADGAGLHGVREAADAAQRLEQLLRAWPDGDGIEGAAALLRRVEAHLQDPPG